MYVGVYGCSSIYYRRQFGTLCRIGRTYANVAGGEWAAAVWLGLAMNGWKEPSLGQTPRLDIV